MLDDSSLEKLADLVASKLIREQHSANIDPDANMLRTVAAILKSFGLESDDEKQINEDFRYLRKWREGSERVTGIGITAVITLLVGGVLSAIWIGFKALMGK